MELVAMPQASFRYKLFLFSLYALAYAVFYQYPNMRPIFEPQYLPLWAIDEKMPFLPWSFIVYTSDYILILSVVLMIRNLEDFQYLTRLAFGVLILSGMFFLFLPTTYPRPDYAVEAHWISKLFMQFVATADTPNNCFPSMHVGLTAAATWAIRLRSHRLFGIYCFWSFLIFISTLTTKQHYFVDILGGLSVLLVVIGLDWAFVTKKIHRNWFSKVTS